MVSVLFRDDQIKVKVPSGKTMREIATKTGASMEFGCRVGDCTTCFAKVESGMELLSEKNEKELKAMQMLGSDNTQLRLMCQCSVTGEEGEVVISYGI